MRKRISNDDKRRDSRPSEGRASTDRSTGRSASRSDGRPSGGRDFNGPRNDSSAPREFRGPRNDSSAPRAPRSESTNRFSSERKPYQGGGERKPYQGGDRKPFDGERKPYQGGGERKPFGRTENPTRTPYKGDNRWDRNATPKVEGSEESTKPRDENPTARIERKYEERTERSADRPERPEGDRNPRYSDREKALEIEKQFSEAYFALAYAYSKNGDNKDACETLNSAKEKGFEAANDLIEEFCK